MQTQRTRALKNPHFERLPRWPGAPNICIHANLPAFETEKQLQDWQELNNPGAKSENWKCNVCLHWHGWTFGPDPAGQSSGTTRTQKHGAKLAPHLARLKAEALAHWRVPMSTTVTEQTTNEELNEQTEWPEEVEGES